MPAHEPTKAAPAIVIVTLAPIESSNQRNPSIINLPKGDQDVVRLHLTLREHKAGTYRAEILNEKGQSVLKTESPKPNEGEAARMDIDVPARMLRTGDYQIKLTRIADRSEKSVATYSFRAQ